MRKPRRKPTPAREATEDGVFKMLTSEGDALTDMLGLPKIEGEPLQQENHTVQERKVDRLFRLSDGSYLHVEHQTRISEPERLAKRLAQYRLLLRETFPLPLRLHQVVVFTGGSPKDRSLVPPALTYDDASSDYLGSVVARVPVKDLLVEPIATFEKSGKLDDLMLGLLGPGRADPTFRENVARRVRALRGEQQRDAKVKFIAICAMIGVDHLVGEVRMWIEDVKDSVFVREIVRIAGQKEREDAERQGREAGRAEAFAEILVADARKKGIEVPEDFADRLVETAGVDALRAMVSDLDELRDDMDEFMHAHGVDMPRFEA